MVKDEQGAGTVLAVGIVCAMLLLMAMVLALGQGAIGAGKAATAADLSALAAADAYRGLSAGSPCQIAADVAALHGAALMDCALASDLSVRVQVSIKTPFHGYQPGWLGRDRLRIRSSQGLPDGSP